MPVYQSRHLGVLLQSLLVKLQSLWPLLQLQMNPKQTKRHGFVWHSLPGHFTHIAAPCVYMWRQGWCKGAQILHSSWHLRTLTAGVAGMSWCSDKIWKDSYCPSSTCWCHSEWLAMTRSWKTGVRCSRTIGPKMTDTTLASDRAGITTEQVFTDIKGFLHFTATQIFETRTLVKTFICTI